MNMTPRKKNKKTNSSGETSGNVSKKTATESTTPTEEFPANVRRSQRRSLMQTSPSPDSCESTPKKSRRTNPSSNPETPSRFSARKKKESTSPLPPRSSPRRSHRNVRGSSTDPTGSNATTSPLSNCSLTPVRRRTRRESNSSSISGTSDTTSPNTPKSPKRGRGSKRKLVDKTNVESPKKANLPSPKSSSGTKRRRECSESATNGKNESYGRSRRNIYKDSPHSSLDGESVKEEEPCVGEENSDNVKSHVEITREVECDYPEVGENGSDASLEIKCNKSISDPNNASINGNSSVKSESIENDENLEKVTGQVTKETQDENQPENKKSLVVPTTDTEGRTCINKEPCTVTPTGGENVISSSHVQSGKRRLSISEPFNGEESEYTKASKRVKQCLNEIPDDSNEIRRDNKNIENPDNPCEGTTTTEMDSSDEVDPVVVRLLDNLNLSDEQSKEICSLLTINTKDLVESKVIEELVKSLLDTAIPVKTMNAPRFNKFLRQLLNHYCSSDTTQESKHDLCEKAVQWARDRKSVNLRHELELTLMSLYYNTCQYKLAEKVACGLYNETKKLQDKEKTVKACLCLSQVYHAMGNLGKARANITTAKTEALKIYTPPDMQGELDLQSGIMQVTEGKDMETAFSYFKEAATGFISKKQRSRALKYMLLSKIMMNRSEEGEKAVRSPSHVQDIDEGVEAMLAIAAAAQKSSLMDFRRLREVYKKYLAEDIVVAGILDDLYITMMEKNLLNIVLPYECIQISHVAEKIGLPREEVERRISQMILDKRISAQLDHRDDCLYVYASIDSDVVYQTGIETLTQLDKTITHLNRKVKKLL